MTRLRPLLRHRRLMQLVTGLAALLVCGLLWVAAGVAVQGWAVGLGMDDERGALVAALLITAAGAAVAATASGRPGAPRVGALLAFTALYVGPFLVRASRVTTTPGLTAHLTPAGWFAQPVGMLLLAIIAISLGTAGGLLARRDLAVLWRVVRRRWSGRAALPVAVLLAHVGAGAATVALQDGPVSALYGYGQAAVGADSATSATPATPPSEDGGGAPDPPLAARSGVTLARRGPLPDPAPRTPVRPGLVVALQVAGRRVDVYLPAGYSASGDRVYPVVYLLHGYPGNPAQWLGAGAQLPAVLDQLIGSGRMPAVIAVEPDGNGPMQDDAEWGDDAHGDRVESWLTGQVVPAIDARYRTAGARYRGIAGLSAGGFGAVNLAVRHPDLFRWAASWSGYFTARTDVFGGQAAANSPDQTVAGLSPARRMPLFIGVGSSDREFLAADRGFVDRLHALGWASLRSEVVAGGHGWEAWRAEMVDSLRWLAGLWGTAPLTAPPPPSPPPVGAP